MTTYLLTGSAGEIGTMLRTALRAPGRTLRLLDIAGQSPAEPGENAVIITGSFTDRSVLDKAMTGVDAVIHLGSLLGGATWAQYVDVNLNGTYMVLEAARRAGVKRVVYASSHHAVGFYPKEDGVTVGDYLYPRPDSYYGVMKVASEALGSLYADRHGMDVICMRIASYRPVPNDRRCLWNWLSPDDCARMVEAALSAASPGFRIIWGISANTRRWMSLDEGKAIGYHPQDDAEDWAEQILATTTPTDPVARYDHYLGALFAAPEFDAEGRDD